MCIRVKAVSPLDLRYKKAREKIGYHRAGDVLSVLLARIRLDDRERGAAERTRCGVNCVLPCFFALSVNSSRDLDRRL